MAFWNKEIETMPRAELEKLQLSLLKKNVRTMYDSSKFIHDRMKSVGISPADVTDLKTFRKIPFTVKTDFRDNYPDKLFVRPYEDLERLHVSSGTTGKPTVVGYTRKDLDDWAESLARGMVSFGMSKRDLIQNAHGYGLFTGGLGVHYAAEKIGATVLPASTGNTERQIQLMRDLPVTAFAGTPSYLFHIAEVCEEKGIDIQRDTKLRLAISGGEPWSESMRTKIQDRTGIRMHNCYGASEFYGPSFLECEKQCGLHTWADICYIEILDKNGDQCAEGERGEIVITMLQKEAFPLIRYKIMDISSLTWEKCECGRTHPRLMRLSGRTDDMLCVRGVNVFPSQIESVIGEIPFLSTFYHITLENKNYMDDMVVEVELNESSLKEDMTELLKRTRFVEDKLKNVLSISAKVKLLLPGTLKRFEGKSQHVTDNRRDDW
ncbi:MAG: phenylacetate--CoA ligase [Candidatus Methanoplasma sp.]|jgi:phenylacetate-CoA ligase|nr:phenylacetate--CoA ligase [Candidatus Methanoplasma sp.]